MKEIDNILKHNELEENIVAKIDNICDNIFDDIIGDLPEEEIIYHKEKKFDLSDYRFAIMIVPKGSIQDMTVRNVHLLYRKLSVTINCVTFLKKHSELYLCFADNAYIPKESKSFSTNNFLELNYYDLPCFVLGFNTNFKYMHQMFRLLCRLTKDANRFKLLKKRCSHKLSYTMSMSFIKYAGNYFKVPGFGEKPFVEDDVQKTMIDIFQFMDGNFRY